MRAIIPSLAINENIKNKGFRRDDYEDYISEEELYIKLDEANKKINSHSWVYRGREYRSPVQRYKCSNCDAYLLCETEEGGIDSWKNGVKFVYDYSEGQRDRHEIYSCKEMTVRDIIE